MSIRLLPCRELTKQDIGELHESLAAYYSNPPTSYYVIADQAASQYNPQDQPFHCDLANRVQPGMQFLELGCGTAHLCPHVEQNGGTYTGMDYSPELLERNSKHFPNAHFFPITEELTQQFDIVASLYTIEHVVDPPAYLERMWGLCKPGGLLAVICPEFIDCPAFPPSIYYGLTPRRFREKIQSLSFPDACLHLLDLKWKAPRWKARACAAPPGAFWINLRASELHGAIHGVDTDAVHLPRLSDIQWWFEQHGASILATSKSLPNVPPEVLRFNTYVLARKP